MRNPRSLSRTLSVFIGVSLSWAASFSDDLSLERIMADPDWMGNGPERPYWSDDGESFFFYRKVEGEERRDLYEMDVGGSAAVVVEPEGMGKISVPGGDWSRDARRKVFEREGDIYVRNVKNGRLQQLTRTAAREHAPSFMTDERYVQFQRGDATFVRDLESGLEYQPADLRTEDDPDEEEDDEDEEDDADYLADRQERLFEIVRSTKEREDARKARDKADQLADPSRVGLPWYLGDDYEIEDSELSPTGDLMLLGLVNSKKREDGKKGTMPNYVTETGYTQTTETRVRVGTAELPGVEFFLLDLLNHEKHSLDLSGLPGISDDPLEGIRPTNESSEDADEETEEDEEDAEPKSRPLQLRGSAWSDDGTHLVLDLISRDNKDRWIVKVDFEQKALVSIHHEHDPAWINWRRVQLGWLSDNDSVYFASEQDGYAHLYLHSIGAGETRQLTAGAWEVSSVVPSKSGKHLYFRANVEHPGVYEIYRVAVATGEMEQLTALGGNNQFRLSPDEKRLLISHSTTTSPYELYLQRAKPGAKAERVTNTISEAFIDLPWAEPEIVAIPSSHVDRPVYSRVYTPEGEAAAKRPAVVFVHGAGYLQNSHQGWSSYFREFMFHSLLVQKGYVVLDMDYRASAGYGRDWRTAIYRQMGTPELEDLEDGVAWLAEHKNVDPARVGVYGGSYGGFMTLMALFRAPDLFACGAALRPVTDWAHYNHGYTSNILNVPVLDPEAYENSSPIEFAEGLTKPLLICHGMQDDNVFYQDSVRLVQRLIELKKENWEFASYPIEAHGFREPSSWLDEYRRILKLFETHLR